jgi:hypothetical protein
MAKANFEALGLNKNHKITLQANGYGFAVKIGRKTWAKNLPYQFDLITELETLKRIGLDIADAINQYNTKIKRVSDATFEEMTN